jgi:hypothetical protein
MYKDKRLSDITNRGKILKKFDAWPSCMMNDCHGDKYKGPEGAKKAISDAMGILQSIRGAGDDFYDSVNGEDLGDIITFLSEKNWDFNRKE